MKSFVFGAAAVAATLTFSAAAEAVGPPYCVDRATPAITAPAVGATKCQTAITKATQKYVKSMIKARGKCIAKGDHTACPNSKDDGIVAKAALKAQESIAKGCTVTAGLGSSYSGVDGNDVGSCTLSQNQADLKVFLGETQGAAGITSGATGRDKCVAAIAKASQTLLPALLKNMDKCIEGKIKAGDTAGMGAACAGSINTALPSPFVAPSDPKTAEAQTKAVDKALGTIESSCGTLSPTVIKSLWGCADALTAEDLKSCVVCNSYGTALSIVDQQYAETGSFIANGVGAIQDAVDDAAPGAKLLIASGDYPEGVLLKTATCNGGTNDDATCLGDGDCPGGACQSDSDGLQLVGCGAATNDRPYIHPPTMSPPNRGFTAAGVDGLLFQGLNVTGWSNDGIFVTNADGVTFRDVYGDGSDLNDMTPPIASVSTYAIFPVVSTGVLIEGCEVTNVRDAGIYVGQSDTIVVRHNYVHGNVTGIEIENSVGAVEYGNVATNNTGGLLEFHLPGPPIQQGSDHRFFDNVSYSNNVPNFGIPGTTVGGVLLGTGVMIISEDDSEWSNNLVVDNYTFGFAILDQNIVNALQPPPPLFDPVSVDQDTSNMRFSFNKVSHNGDDADLADPNAPEGYIGDYVYALSTDTLGTCFEGNLGTHVALHSGMVAFPPCM